jgi:cystathionine gamma-lyase/cystathionine beta-lyase/cystathionine gamma-lyase/homocysteine desulfhydrase
MKKKNSKQLGFATRAIHAGQQPDPLTGSVTVPIYPTSTYVQQGIGEHKGYEYSRVSNPTRARLEENLCALEGGVAARVFGSGMAAINATWSAATICMEVRRGCLTRS